VLEFSQTQRRTTMKSSGLFPRKGPLSFLLLAISLSAAAARMHGAVPEFEDASRLQLTIADREDAVAVSWMMHPLRSDLPSLRPIYQLEGSADLTTWTALADPESAVQGAIRTLRQIATTSGQGQMFFRVTVRFVETLPTAEPALLGDGGDEVFGYADQFERELARVGELTLKEFESLYPAPENYVSPITFDPTASRYWDLFNIPPDPMGSFSQPKPGQRVYDFRLNETELALFKKNGFVVSERLETHSFAESLYRIWMSDLPIFVSSDALLQAWHRSYDMMLEELETLYLFENLQRILDGMAAQLQAALDEAGDGALRESVLDADYLVTVARSLLAGQAVASPLSQDARVKKALDGVASLQLDTCFDLFKYKRGMDFSQFQVRGHYENSELLGRYFKCVMWLGRIDLRIAGGPFLDSDCELAHPADPRELGTAVILHWLLHQSGQFERWKSFDQIIQAFVGQTDSMTFAQLLDLLNAAGLKSLGDLSTESALLALQDSISEGRYGVQDILGDYFGADHDGKLRKLPRSFTVFGQKFILDSWALSHLVWGRGLPVMRRVPSSLDVAFSVLGNDHVVPDLVNRIADTSETRHEFRDGMPYQRHLAAVRRVIDHQPWETWQSNIYMDWLGTLRTLSAPLTSDLRYPEVFRTEAWAMKTLNTQLASWTHLRHDTILYAKPSYTPNSICSFPDGYVEPVPAFWSRLSHLAARTAALLSALAVNDPIANSGNVLARPVAFLRHFAEHVARLEQISLRQLAHLPLAPSDLEFLNQLIEHLPETGSGSFRQFNGWYPSLFYRSALSARPDSFWFPPASADSFHMDYGADKMDGIIADVHTDVPCPVCDDPGSVLHQAVGYVNLLIIAVQRGAETFVCAGPVLSHYEFELIGAPRRMNDSQWRSALGWWNEPQFFPVPEDVYPAWRKRANGRPLPSPPPWTGSYLVPAP
jgi:hypothetical protein